MSVTIAANDRSAQTIASSLYTYATARLAHPQWTARMHSISETDAAATVADLRSLWTLTIKCNVGFFDV